MSTELATLKKTLSSETMREQFAKALPRHLSPERFCRIAITALTRTPKLAECTQESLMKCLLDLSAFGLEPDGRRAHLIPYKDQCTLVIDWKGLAELALRSGVIAKLHADIVCTNDTFVYDMGEVTQHGINWQKPRGEMYAAYAMAQTKTGEKFFAVMSKDEIDAIMNRSQGYKAAIQYKKSHPWLSDYNEMAKKTAFRRLSKWLPLSPEFRDAVDRDDEDNDLNQLRDVTPSQPRGTALAKPMNPFQPKPEPVDMFAAEVPPMQPLELVKAKLAEDGIEWTDFSQYLLDNGLLDDKRNNPDDCTDAELRSTLAAWSGIVAYVKGGVK